MKELLETAAEQQGWDSMQASPSLTGVFKCVFMNPYSDAC